MALTGFPLTGSKIVKDELQPIAPATIRPYHALRKAQA